MMNVFSPMQGMNAFAQGANIGGNIRQQETQSKLAPLVANGQYQQAAQVAGERGDLGSAELYRTQYEDQLSQMGEQEKIAAAKRAEDLGRVAVGLKGVPYEQRQAMLQQQLPMLQAMGMDPQQIQGFDPNDQNLDAVLAQVTPLQDLLKGPEYFAPVETENGFTQFSKDGSDPRQFEGIAPAQEPIEVNGVLVDPVTYEPVANFQTPSQTGELTDYQSQQLAIERQKMEQTPETADAYGLTPVYGLDENGNRVILQTSKSGNIGMPEIPEGISIESPYDRSFAQTAGKTDAKKEAYRTAEGLKVQAAEEEFARLSSQIDSAIDLADKGNTGFFGQYKPSPDLDAVLETIEATSAFNTLVELKSQGGTLGALSETELDLLKAKIANVRRSQSQEQLEANLEILKLSMGNSLGRLKQAYEAEYESGRIGGATPAASGGQGAVGPSGQPVPEGFE